MEMTESFYLSGPMTGVPEFNYPYFRYVAAALRKLGYSVVNPAELTAGSTDRIACLRQDIKALCDCSGLILLPGWEGSVGAHLELHLAHRLELRIHTLSDFLLERNHDPI